MMRMVTKSMLAAELRDGLSGIAVTIANPAIMRQASQGI
jgi:hypothetical protein